MNKLTDLYSIDGIDIDFVAKKITALNTDKKRIESEMNAINEHKPLISAEDAKEKIIRYIQHLRRTENLRKRLKL